MFWAAAIPAAMSAAGGIAGSLIQAGQSGANNAATMAFNREQLQFQRDAAMMGIRWKVDDAKAAGIHPLYAIGAPPFSPSPISMNLDPGPDWSSSLSNMGQNVGRAIAATRSNGERVAGDHDAHVQALSRETQALQNDLLRVQIAGAMQALSSRGQGQVGPGMPVTAPAAPRTAATNQAEIKPNEITSSQGDIPHAAAGPVAPSNQWRQGPDGTVYPSPEKNLQIDDMGSPGWLPWMTRNHVVPYFDQLRGRDVQYAAPPKSMLPPGATSWRKAWDGAWVPQYPDIDRDVQRTRHNRAPAYPYVPQYERYR